MIEHLFAISDVLLNKVILVAKDEGNHQAMEAKGQLILEVAYNEKFKAKPACKFYPINLYIIYKKVHPTSALDR